MPTLQAKMETNHPALTSAIYAVERKGGKIVSGKKTKIIPH
jgi:hypothetical protein